MKKIVLIGGGGHCRSVVDVIEQEGKFSIAGIVEKFRGESKEVLGYPLIGVDDELELLRQKYEYAFITIGHIKLNSVRRKLFDKLQALEFTMPTVISPFAYVSKYAELGEGTIVMHHALVNANVQVGKNCIINSKALLEHDVCVEDNCHISTNTTLNGGVCVQENSFIGSGAVVREGMTVEGFVKAGSLVK